MTRRQKQRESERKLNYWGGDPSALDYQTANNIIDEENRLFQGEDTSRVFEGRSVSRAIQELYGESAQDFARIIGERMSNETPYKIIDFGSHKGELLTNILNLLPQKVDFYAIAVDTEKNLKENNVAHEKIPADLGDIPLGDRTAHAGIARYVLVWNTPEKQIKILNEIARVIKEFAIIQHAGADNQDTDAWRETMNHLLDGSRVKKVQRHGHFFSSREEVESFMRREGITFERVSERKIDGVSDVFIERFALNEQEAEATRHILGDKDYIVQTTWLILPKS